MVTTTANTHQRLLSTRRFEPSLSSSPLLTFRKTRDPPPPNAFIPKHQSAAAEARLSRVILEQSGLGHSVMFKSLRHKKNKMGWSPAKSNNCLWIVDPYPKVSLIEHLKTENLNDLRHRLVKGNFNWTVRKVIASKRKKLSTLFFEHRIWYKKFIFWFYFLQMVACIFFVISRLNHYEKSLIKGVVGSVSY